MAIMDRDEVEDLRNWQCRDGNDLSDDQLNALCDSNEALRDLLRRVVCEECRAGSDASCFHHHGPHGNEQCDCKLRSCLRADLRAEVDAAVEG